MDGNIILIVTYFKKTYICSDPERNDFIIKAVTEKKITTDSPEEIIAEIKRKIVKLEAYIQKYQTCETAEI